jgi:hypothetical protein
MALLSFRGISTPSLQAQGEQRRLPISTSAGTIPTPMQTFLDAQTNNEGENDCGLTTSGTKTQSLNQGPPVRSSIG